MILSGVTGSFRPGTVTAIMGPSGAGKTTLMTVMLDKQVIGTHDMVVISRLETERGARVGVGVGSPTASPNAYTHAYNHAYNHRISQLPTKSSSNYPSISQRCPTH